MSKTIFSEYANMPIMSTVNDWFSKYIKLLNGLVISKDYVVEINKTNSRIIERAIKTNPSYNANFTKKIYEYYCCKFRGTFPKTGKNAKEPITDLIRMIDLENSTNVWRYKKNRMHLINMVNYIIDSNNNFWDRLDRGDTSLVNDLKKASKATTDGPKSLASKTCKYFSEMFFGKDNYFINDNVVRHVLPYYLDYYGITPEKNTKTYFDNLDYEDLHDYLEQLRIKVNPTLTKSDVDHIMWYCYRFEK